MTRITLLLADDQLMFRQGIRALLAEEIGLEVVAEAGAGREAVRLAEEKRPDVVLMDARMPGLNGMQATRRIRSRVPETRVLALSAHPDQRHIEEMLQAGASGYLLKDDAFEELVQAILAVAAGRTYLSPSIAGTVVRDLVGHLSGEEPSSRLTPRQREVLGWLAEGSSTREVANRLGLSVKTVESHRQRIMSRLNVRSIAELTKYAVREGLTSID